MAKHRIEGDLHITGALTMGELGIPDSTITNADVEADADIDASKLEHSHRGLHTQNGTAVAATEVMHVVYGATGTIKAVKAGSVVAATGNATMTVDVKKNGTTVLSAPIVLDSTNTAYIVEAGMPTVTTLVAGDVLTAVVTVDAGTGALGTGLFVEAEIWEVTA